MNDYELHKKEKLEAEKSAERSEFFKQIKFWGSVVIGIGLVVAGLIYVVAHYESPKTDIASVTIENTFYADDWIKGNKEAKVVLVEYSDFQCPACGAYEPVLQKLTADFGDKIAFAYRHFPLPGHQHALVMAHAAEAAGKQNKFWEMHDMIFTNQQRWSTQPKSGVEKVIEEYAKVLGLNMDQFNRDINSDEVDDRVQRDVKYGNDVGISYTPTFFLNGQRITNPKSYEEFSALITEKLNENI